MIVHLKHVETTKAFRARVEHKRLWSFGVIPPVTKTSCFDPNTGAVSPLVGGPSPWLTEATNDHNASTSRQTGGPSGRSNQDDPPGPPSTPPCPADAMLLTLLLTFSIDAAVVPR